MGPEEEMMVASGLEQQLAELEAMPETIAAQVAGIPADRWETPVWGAEGGWNRRQLLAHIASINLRYLTRMRLATGLPDPNGLTEATLPPIDESNAAEVSRLADRSVDELLQELRSNRAELVRLARSLTPEQRQRFQMRRGDQTLTIEQWPAFVLAHDRTHLAEIAG
jgi:uncharacterized damage-inducible protein DinB